MIFLRDYQAAGKDKIREAYRNGSMAVCYQLPTGGGKSPIMNDIAANIAANGGKVVISVHRKRLIRQICHALEFQDIPFGVIAPGYSRSNASIQIASVWTLARRLSQWTNFDPDLIAFDESHHIASRTWAEVLAAFPRARKLGFTATPQRLDGIGLSEFFDTLICGPTMRELIGRGFLAPYSIYYPPSDIDLRDVHVRMGDYVARELHMAMDKPSITGSAVEYYGKLIAPRPAIAFCVSIDHCKHVAEQFRKAGFAAESVDGEMHEREQNARLDDLGKSLNVITSCELLTEGLDVPACQGVIGLRPTWSLTLYLQMFGRGTRPKTDKDGQFGPGGTHRGEPMVFVDHVGNCHRHGLPDADREREWTLEGRKRSSRDQAAPGVRVCASCYCVFGVSTRICPKCRLEVPKREYDIEERPGELVRLTPEQQRALWRDEQRDPNVLNRAVSPKTQDYQEDKLRRRLTKLAAERGYRDGWVDHILDAKRKKLAQKQAATSI